MPQFRATVDYGDDRIRQYLVNGIDIDDATAAVIEYAKAMLTIDVLDDADEFDEDDFDGEL